MVDAKGMPKMPPSQMEVDDETMEWAEQLANSRAQALETIERCDTQYEDPGEHVYFGTAGFRDHHTKVQRTAFRLALLIAMRCKTQGTCGVMVTASQYHHEDNGIKLIDKGGNFLNPDWELLSEMIVNSVDLEWSMKNLNEL